MADSGAKLIENVPVGVAGGADDGALVRQLVDAIRLQVLEDMLLY